jgi:hypothetical protein
MIPSAFFALWSMVRGSWVGRAAAALVAAGIIGRILYWRGAREGRRDSRAAINEHERERVDGMQNRVDAAWKNNLRPDRNVDDQLRELGRLRDGN